MDFLPNSRFLPFEMSDSSPLPPARRSRLNASCCFSAMNCQGTHTHTATCDVAHLTAQSRGSVHRACSIEHFSTGTRHKPFHSCVENIPRKPQHRPRESPLNAHNINMGTLL